MQPFLNFFGLEIPSYGVCVALGFIFALVFSLFFCARRKLSLKSALTIIVCAAIFGIIGAKLLSVTGLFSPREILNLMFREPMTLISQSGFVFYGGFIFGALAAVVSARILKVTAADLSEYESIFITALPAAHALGRIGCFLAGCCYGIEAEPPLGIAFENPVGGAPQGIPLLPIQLFEASYNLVLFCVLLIMLVKRRSQRFNLPVYLIGYGAERFFAEMFRGDEVRGFFGGLSTSGWISAAAFIFGICLFIKRFRGREHSKM